MNPVTVNVTFEERGNYLVGRCCAVTGGNPHFFAIAVDKRVIAKQLMPLYPGDHVSGFGHWLKKAVKNVGKIKIVKGIAKTVGGVVKEAGKIAKNPIFGAALTLIPGVGLLGAAASISANAVGAINVASKALDVVKTGKSVVNTAKDAVKVVNRAKAAASLVGAGKLSKAKAAPIVKKGIAVRDASRKNAPALAKRVVAARNVQGAFANLATKAKAGNPDARLTANVIARTAKMHDEISAIQTKRAGGTPGLLVTSDGRIARAPRGKWIQTSSAPKLGTGDALYRGTAEAALRGKFSASVSGGEWPGGLLVNGSVDPRDKQVHEMARLLGAHGYAPGAAIVLRSKGMTSQQLARLVQSSEKMKAHGFSKVSGLRSQSSVGSESGSGSGAETRDLTAGSWGDDALEPEGVQGPRYPISRPDIFVEGAYDVGQPQGASWLTWNPEVYDGGAREDAALSKSRVSGVRGPRDSEMRKLAKARLELARLIHQMKTAQKRLQKITKVGGDMNDLPEEMTQQSDGVAADSMVGADLMVGCDDDVGCALHVAGRRLKPPTDLSQRIVLEFIRRNPGTNLHGGPFAGDHRRLHKAASGLVRSGHLTVSNGGYRVSGWGGSSNPEIVGSYGRVRLDRGGYADRGRRYFGHGDPIYKFESPDGEHTMHVRAPGPMRAKAMHEKWLAMPESERPHETPFGAKNGYNMSKISGHGGAVSVMGWGGSSNPEIVGAAVDLIGSMPPKTRRRLLARLRRARIGALADQSSVIGGSPIAYQANVGWQNWQSPTVGSHLAPNASTP